MTSTLTQLHGFITSNDWENTNRLLQSGCDVNAIVDNESACTRAIISSADETIVHAIISTPNFSPNIRNSDGKSALYLAVEKSRKDIAQHLIARGADVNTSDDRKVSPLIVAIRRGEDEIAELLVENAADINQMTANGETPLYNACDKANLKCAQYLLERGADVNSTTNHLHPRTGQTPLMAALPYGFTADVCKKKCAAIDIIKQLIMYDCDLDAQDERGNTALHIAADQNDIHVVSILAAAGASVCIRNTFGVTAFENAIHPDVQRYGVASVLLLYGYQIENVNEHQHPLLSIMKGIANSKYFEKSQFTRKTLLHLLSNADFHISNDALDQLKLMAETLSSSLTDNDKCIFTDIFTRSTPYSLQRHCRKVIRSAIKKNMMTNIDNLVVAPVLKRVIALDFDYVNRNPLNICNLMLAIEKQDFQEVKSFLNFTNIDPDFSFGDFTPLTLASNIGVNKDIFQLLLEKHARLDVLDCRNYSAIHVAAEKGNIEMLEVILQTGFDINFVNTEEETALFKAAERGQFPAMMFLLEKGANPTQPNKSGFFAIHFAAASGHVDGVRALLQHVHPNQRDPWNNTALHLAASRGLLYTTQNIELPALFSNVLSMSMDGFRNMLGYESSTKYFKVVQKDEKEKINHKVVVKLLIEAGADKAAVNGNNFSPFQIANKFKSEDILEYLR